MSEDKKQAAPTAEEKAAPRRAPQSKLGKEDQTISDLVIPGDQLLVGRGREFLKTLSEQELVACSLPASADEGSGKAGYWKFDINGVSGYVPVGKVVNVPLSVASLIADVSVR